MTVKVVALIVAAFIARLKVAVICLPPPATPLVLVVADWLPLLGEDAVTVGMVALAATVHVAPGAIAPRQPCRPGAETQVSCRPFFDWSRSS